MYNQFFALRENPFNVNPDPRYLFLTRQTAEACDGLKQGIQARKGLLLLTGEVGTGKTTLLNHLLDWLHQQRAPTAFIFNSHLEISHLFEFMLSDFAVQFDARLKDNTQLRLHQWLWERYRAGDTPVVIVDEAQGLPDRVLEEIRMLLNLETSNEKLLQIVLAGQPELEARLQQPGLRQVKQRIALRFKTAPLSLDEAHRYIQTRLHIAGAGALRIFAPDAMDAVHFYSRGIPRVMNLLCEHALINASAAQIQPVPARFVAEVASEFQFDDCRPLARTSNSTDVPHSDEIPPQSRFLNALVSLSTTNEHEPPFAPASEHPTAPPSEQAFESRPEPGLAASSKQDFAARSEQSLALISEQNFATRSAEAVAAISDHAITPKFDRNFAAPVEALNVQATAPAAPWLRQLEARLLADWTSYFSEIGSAIELDPTSEPISEPVAPIHPPRLHLVESKSAPALSPAASRRPVPNFQNSAQLASRVGARKSVAPISAVTKLVALSLILAGWLSTVNARLLSAVTAVARSRTVLVSWISDATPHLLSARSAATRSRTLGYLTQLRTRCESSARSLYRESRACAHRCLTVAASIDWKQLWLTASTWLRQPCDPTQWRLQSVRPFNELLRFNHKKT
jgi:general secretion pathway protein A